MTDTQSVSEAWWEVLKYAHQPNATIKTAQRGSVNKIGVESADEIFFRKDDGDKRTVSRTEFNEIWKTLRSEGQITRKEVGEMTAGWAGAALFGALNDIFDFELDTSTSPIKLSVE